MSVMMNDTAYEYVEPVPPNQDMNPAASPVENQLASIPQMIPQMEPNAPATMQAGQATDRATNQATPPNPYEAQLDNLQANPADNPYATHPAVQLSPEEQMEAEMDAEMALQAQPQPIAPIAPTDVAPADLPAMQPINNMVSTALQFTGNIPEHYDQGLGPTILDDFARDLAKRVAAKHPKRVLELAAGTGILSRKLRDVLPEDCELIVTDLNVPMLDRARAKFKPEENVYFDQIDAMDIAFPNSSFDVVVSQFGVMFMPDRPDAFAEARRVLKPGGAFIFNSWGTMAQNPFARVINEAAARYFPAEAPPLYYQIPFSYSDPHMVTRDMSAGGFNNFEFQYVDTQAEISDFAAFARGLVQGNPLVHEIRAIGVLEQDVMRAVEEDLREVFPDRSMPLRAIAFDGWL
jgi:SAM-dependent methyltransferase